MYVFPHEKYVQHGKCKKVQHNVSWDIMGYLRMTQFILKSNGNENFCLKDFIENILNKYR